MINYIFSDGISKRAAGHMKISSDINSSVYNYIRSRGFTTSLFLDLSGDGSYGPSFYAKKVKGDNSFYNMLMTYKKDRFKVISKIATLCKENYSEFSAPLFIPIINEGGNWKADYFQVGDYNTDILEDELLDDVGDTLVGPLPDLAKNIKSMCAMLHVDSKLIRGFNIYDFTTKKELKAFCDEYIGLTTRYGADPANDGEDNDLILVYAVIPSRVAVGTVDEGLFGMSLDSVLERVDIRGSYGVTLWNDGYIRDVYAVEDGELPEGTLYCFEKIVKTEGSVLASLSFSDEEYTDYIKERLSFFGDRSFTLSDESKELLVKYDSGVMLADDYARDADAQKAYDIWLNILTVRNQKVAYLRGFVKKGKQYICIWQ